MDRSKVIYALIWLVGMAIYLALPGTARISLWVGIALVSVGVTLLGVVMEGIGWLRRRRNIKHNRLDPELRSLVMSDTSWENGAQVPDFCEAALTAFRFLVDEEGFSPARMDRDMRVLSFRRADVVVNVGEGVISQEGKGMEAFVGVVLARNANSFRPVAEVFLGSETHALGDGHRGTAYHLRSHLDQIIEELRAAAAANPPMGYQGAQVDG